jgi:hypothetical protein
MAARKAWAVHWGTFILTDEPIQQPMAELAMALREQDVSAADLCCRPSAKPSGCHDALVPMASDCPELAQFAPFCCNANIARHGWGHTIDTVNFFENEGFFRFHGNMGRGMTILQLINERVQAALAAAGAPDAPAVIQPASKPEFGDYQANGVMGAPRRSRPIRVNWRKSGGRAGPARHCRQGGNRRSGLHQYSSCP